MLCAVTAVAFNGVAVPYEVVEPYSTIESDASFVVQVITAPVAVTDPACTLVIVGGVVSAAFAVVKVKSPEVAVLPAASLLRTL